MSREMLRTEGSPDSMVDRWGSADRGNGKERTKVSIGE